MIEAVDACKKYAFLFFRQYHIEVVHTCINNEESKQQNDDQPSLECINLLGYNPILQKI